MIAEGHTSLARDNRFERSSLNFIRSLIYNDLAFAVPLFDFAKKYTHQGPIQARQRRAVEMAFNDSTDIGKLTISVCGWLVELTSAAHGTIAVVVGMALEFPIVRHLMNPPGCVGNNKGTKDMQIY